MSYLAEYNFPVPHWYCDCGYEKMVPWTWRHCPYCGKGRSEDAEYLPANWVGKSRGKSLKDVKKTWRFEFDDGKKDTKHKAKGSTKDRDKSGSSSKSRST